MKRQKTVKIAVKDQTEAENIERALNDVATRAFVNIVGALLPLGTPARTRILTFVNDTLNDGAGRVSIESVGDQHHVEATKALAN